jgi:hypothetical protein
MAKMFSAQDDAWHSSHGPEKFPAWLCQHSRYKNLYHVLKKHVGNRNDVLFENALPILHMWEAAADYLRDVMSNNDSFLVRVLREALKSKTLKAVVKARAMAFLNVWQPLRVKINDKDLATKYSDMQAVAQAFEAELEQGIEGRSGIMSQNYDMYKDEAVVDQMGKIKEHHPEVISRVFAKSHELDSTVSQLIQAGWQGTQARYKNFMGAQLEGGHFFNPSEGLKARLDLLPVTSDRVETVFGLFTSIQKGRAPGTSVWNVSAATIWMYHKTSERLLELPDAAGLALVELAMRRKKLDVAHGKERYIKMMEAKAARRDAATAKTEAADRKRLLGARKTLLKEGSLLCTTLATLEVAYEEAGKQRQGAVAEGGMQPAEESAVAQEKRRLKFVKRQLALLRANRVQKVPTAGKDLPVAIIYARLQEVVHKVEAGDIVLADMPPTAPESGPDMLKRERAFLLQASVKEKTFREQIEACRGGEEEEGKGARKRSQEARKGTAKGSCFDRKTKEKAGDEKGARS